MLARRAVVGNPEGATLMRAGGPMGTARSHDACREGSAAQVRGADLIVGGELRLAGPDAGEVALPVEPGDGEPLTVRVWDSTCPAIAPSRAADRWLSGYLGLECRLDRKSTRLNSSHRT